MRTVNKFLLVPIGITQGKLTLKSMGIGNGLPQEPKHLKIVYLPKTLLPKVYSKYPSILCLDPSGY